MQHVCVCMCVCSQCLSICISMRPLLTVLDLRFLKSHNHRRADRRTLGAKLFCLLTDGEKESYRGGVGESAHEEK